MTEAPSAPAPDPAGQPEPERVLSRHRDGRVITGVCAGLGRYTGMDPVLFRVGFAVLVLASGIGVMLYVAAFLLMRRPDGGPGHLEQWTRRTFDAETVLALLAAVFAFGLIINVASGGINRGTIVVGTLLAIVLMAAHARGVDLLTMARSMPERATGRRGMTRSTPGFAPFAPFAQEPYAPAPQPAETTAMPGTYGPQAAGRGPEPSARQSADGVSPEDTAVRRFASEPTRETVKEPVRDTTSGPMSEPGAEPTGDTVTESVRDVDAEHGAGSAPRADGDPPTRAFETPAGTAPVSGPGARGSGAPDSAKHDPGTGDPGPRDFGAGGPVPPPRAADGYRRLSDLAREARANARGDLGSPGQAPGRASGQGYGTGGSQGYGAGEPFAPHGPYTMREPYRPLGTPYAADPYGPPVAPPPPRPKKPKRPRSFVSGLTICLALIVGGIMVTMQRTGTGTVGLPVVGGAVLVTIGAGLLVAAWFGRGGGLVAAGTIVALVLVGSTTVNGIPRKVGSYVWHPVTAVQAPSTYELGIGEGKLDLSDVPLKSGARLRFDASVSLGQLTVIVPPTARIEVHGFTKLGEVRIDHTVEDGTNVWFDRVLEPETPGKGDVPTIELHVKAGVGDVEVRRAA
ncbi:PspC domain-containing protein [Microbispora triticiradicis]|uniref:PspC domain-containing protein n=1 Tax=Microbispora triticiradicis TaxID=2200763 RepID=UPI001AD7E340|nr:PspC domain-containing protein [Microbispora triticiradicis]MBO4270478.1 PspC domain-containing protein [Microbispora triticiradicis]